jgi:class 3 adenylate cyclase
VLEVRYVRFDDGVLVRKCPDKNGRGNPAIYIRGSYLSMKWNRPEVISNRQFRADFEITPIKFDDTTRVAHFEIRPDPRRYTLVEQDGERFYLDRYLNYLIKLEDMMSRMGELPISTASQSIDSTPEYAERRRKAVEHELTTGEHVAPEEKARPHETFITNATTRSMAFVSVDICSSTAHRLRNPEGFDKAYRIFLRELGAIVGLFQGVILKTKGDGFIAYIDLPSFTIACDLAVDMGLSFLVVLKRTINPALRAAGLEPLQIRVGADYGTATTQKINIPATGFLQEDVVSDALNRSVKIEETCQPNQLRIGRALYELIHVQWLERASEVTFDGESVGVEDYKVYEVR